jgi:hypothetical protein
MTPISGFSGDQEGLPYADRQNLELGSYNFDGTLASLEIINGVALTAAEVAQQYVKRPSISFEFRDCDNDGTVTDAAGGELQVLLQSGIGGIGSTPPPDLCSEHGLTFDGAGRTGNARIVVWVWGGVFTFFPLPPPPPPPSYRYSPQQSRSRPT